MIFDKYSSLCRHCGQRIFLASADNGQEVAVHAKQVPNEHTNEKGDIHLEERHTDRGRTYLHIERASSRPRQKSFFDKDRAFYYYVQHSVLCKPTDGLAKSAG